MSDGFDRLKARKTRTGSVTLALDPDDATRLNDARQKAKAARVSAQAKPERQPLQVAADDAEAALAEVEAQVVTFTVHMRGIGPARVEELMLEHKATEAQKRKARQLNNGDPKAQPQWNDETFPPALLSEAIEQITFSDDEAATITDLGEARMKELWAERWPISDKQLIFLKALSLDQSSSQVERLGEG